jgi:hypothetical protein
MGIDWLPPASQVNLFGVRLSASIELPQSYARLPELYSIRIQERDQVRSDRQIVDRIVTDGIERFRLEDGGFVIRREAFGQFSVSSAGSEIGFARVEPTEDAELADYLVGPVLSYALLNLGLDSLHASVVEIEGNAVGFLGDSGFGKSTTAAALVAAGARLVSDDILVPFQPGTNEIHALAGPARSKVTPLAHGEFFPELQAVPIEDGTRVLVNLPEEKCVTTSVPLVHLFVIRERAEASDPLFGAQSPTAAFEECVRNTFNSSARSDQRMPGHFTMVTSLLRFVPVCWIAVPRGVHDLPRLHDAIRMHLASHVLER